jgi:ketosteroid isomerase-like protein
MFSRLAFSADPGSIANESNEALHAVRAELHAAVTDWIAATNSRDLDAQIEFYPTEVEAFYLWRNASREAVFKEKRRVFDEAEVVDINIDAPQIILAPDLTSARMYFRKRYVIVGERTEREGEVLQELRWRKDQSGWKIVSERDLRVIKREEDA